jgi:hypothetical protein
MLLRLSAAAVALLVSYAAFAQGTPAQRAACRPDVTKFCKGKTADPGEILGCLEANKDKISEKCRVVISENDKPLEKKDETKKEEKKDEKK